MADQDQAAVIQPDLARKVRCTQRIQGIIGNAGIDKITDIGGQYHIPLPIEKFDMLRVIMILRVFPLGQIEGRKHGHPVKSADVSVLHRKLEKDEHVAVIILITDFPACLDGFDLFRIGFRQQGFPLLVSGKIIISPGQTALVIGRKGGKIIGNKAVKDRFLAAVRGAEHISVRQHQSDESESGNDRQHNAGLPFPQGIDRDIDDLKSHQDQTQITGRRHSVRHDAFPDGIPLQEEEGDKDIGQYDADPHQQMVFFEGPGHRPDRQPDDEKRCQDPEYLVGRHHTGDNDLQNIRINDQKSGCQQAHQQVFDDRNKKARQLTVQPDLCIQQPAAEQTAQNDKFRPEDQHVMLPVQDQRHEDSHDQHDADGNNAAENGKPGQLMDHPDAKPVERQPGPFVIFINTQDDQDDAVSSDPMVRILPEELRTLTAEMDQSGRNDPEPGSSAPFQCLFPAPVCFGKKGAESPEHQERNAFVFHKFTHSTALINENRRGDGKQEDQHQGNGICIGCLFVVAGDVFYHLFQFLFHKTSFL